MTRKRTRTLGALLALGLVFALLGATASADGAKRELTAEEQYAQAKGALLYIRSYYQSGGLKTTGSGFVVSADGLAVTAAHVIDKAAKVAAVTPDGKELDCAVVSSDAATDVAVLRLPKGKYAALTLASASPNGGALLRAMGYPLKDTLVITEGVVAAPEGMVSEKRRMLVTCDVVNGMSGGPVFDRFGQVVGVCSGSVRTMDGIHLSARWTDLNAAVNGKEAAK